jgi:hypothetical protein
MNAAADEVRDHVLVSGHPFQFHGGGAGLHQGAGGARGFLDSTPVRQERHVGDHNHVGCTTADSGGVQAHHFQCRMDGGRQAVDDHGEAVAH